MSGTRTDGPAGGAGRDKEIRSFAIDEVHLEERAEGEDAPPKIVGHAAVFNQLSEDLGGFRERIAPGAFSKTLGADVRALFNHDPSMIIGRTTSRTLRLSEDAKGLMVEITPPDTPMARHVVESIRRRDITQMSFGFRTREDTFERTDDGIVRTLLDVELFDVSPVTFPAYPQTDAAVRSLEAWKGENDDEADDDNENDAGAAADADPGDEQRADDRLALMRMRQRQAETV